VTKPAEPSRIQLVTAAEQGAAGAGSTRVSPNDRLLLVTDKRMYGFTGHRSESSRFNTTFAGLDVGFYRHGEQPRFRYAKYANSDFRTQPELLMRLKTS
jgi:hypothetical protein